MSRREIYLYLRTMTFNKLIYRFVFSSICKINADEEAEQNLRVLESCDEKFVDWSFEKSLVNLLLIEKNICIDFDLDIQNLNLISSNFQLIWLAVKLKAFNWVNFAINISFTYLLSLDECKFNIRIKIVALVFKRQFELLDSMCLLDCQRNHFLTSHFVVKLSHASQRWII